MTPGLLAECRRVLPAIRGRATLPATNDEIEAIIAAKFATYRQPERTPAEWAMFWTDYHTVLADVPGSALKAAMDAILKDPEIEFLPKPAKLREIALMTENRAVRAFDRARQAIELADAPRAEETVKVPLPDLKMRGPRPEPSHAEKERVRREMREYIAQDDARKAAQAAKAKANLPDSSGPVTESGLTEAMKAKIIKDHNGPLERNDEWSGK